MSAPLKLVVFLLDEQRFAIDLADVERVVEVVEITPLPEAPSAVLGVIKVKDRVLPVFSARRKFGLPEREVELSDQMIVARAPAGPLALLVDAVEELVDCGGDVIVSAEPFFRGSHAVEGVAKTPDGLVLIHNLERFLSEDEWVDLEKLLPAGSGS